MGPVYGVHQLQYIKTSCENVSFDVGLLMKQWMSGVVQELN